MNRGLFSAASIVALVAFAVPAQASHIFVSNVGIGGIALDSMTGPTNPILNVTQGGSLNFTGDMRGQSDTLNVTINGVSGLSQNSFSIAFGGGNASFSQGITFNTAGVVNGLVTYDFPVSFPDYLAPNGQQFSERTLGFTVNVAGAVPEPASWALMILGFGMVGVASRRRSRVTVKYA